MSIFFLYLFSELCGQESFCDNLPEQQTKEKERGSLGAA